MRKAQFGQTNSGYMDSGQTDSGYTDSGSKDAATGNAAYRNDTDLPIGNLSNKGTVQLFTGGTCPQAPP